jgi:hypothetical protein
LAAGCQIGQALWPNVQPELIEARIMPQNSQFIGVNSVTNIELDKGVMPAPIIRNADWFEKRTQVHIADRVLLPYRGCLKTPEGACYADSIIVPYLYRIVANGRFTSVNVQ